MSIHKSLNLGGGIVTERSVWTRRERIEKLLEEERRTEDDRATGLPKVRTKFKVLSKKQRKALDDAQAGLAGGDAAGTEGEGADAAEGGDSADSA